MNKKRVIITSVIFLLVIIAGITLWGWQEYEKLAEHYGPRGFSCFEGSFYTYSPEYNNACILENGSLKLDIKFNPIEEGHISGLQLNREDRVEVIDDIINGEPGQREIHHQQKLIFLDKEDYDFPENGGERTIIIGGDYRNITYLEVASVIKYGETFKECDYSMWIDPLTSCEAS